MSSIARREPGSRQPSQYVIAGAGLLGRLLAWRLLRLGHKVSLLDREPATGEGAAGRVAAAMLAPYSEAVAAERSVFDAGLAALQIWPRWLEELAADDPEQRPIYCQQRGSIVVAHHADAANLAHFEGMLRHKLPDHQQSIQVLDDTALMTLEPELVPTFGRGLYLAGEGCLDNRALFDSLARAIPALGGQWHANVEVTRVEAGAVWTREGQCYTADVAIDCRGFGARSQQADLRGVRGEVLWVRAPEVQLSRPVRLMHPRYQLYIVPRPDAVYVIGATEIESESRAPITVRSGLELQSALYSVHTGFAEASILRAYANLRPAFADNLPRAQLEDGRWQINGLFRHGYLLAPVLINAVLHGRVGSVEGEALDPAGVSWVKMDASLPGSNGPLRESAL